MAASAASSVCLAVSVALSAALPARFVLVAAAPAALAAPLAPSAAASVALLALLAVLAASSSFWPQRPSLGLGRGVLGGRGTSAGSVYGGFGSPHVAGLAHVETW